MRRLHSLRGKLLLVVATTTIAALAASSIVMGVYDLTTFRAGLVEQLNAHADVLGLAAAPTLVFDDEVAAEEYLMALEALPAVRSAAIYTAKGALFASYAREGEEPSQLPQLPDTDGYQIAGSKLTLFRRIIQNGEIIGTVFFSVDYRPIPRVLNFVGMFGLVLVASLAVAALMFVRLQKTVTGPILDIAALAGRVVENRDFSLRAELTTKDEVGALAGAFNSMLAEIGARTEVLEESNAKLQQEIAERERAEREVQYSELRMRTLVSALTQIIWVADEHGCFAPGRDSWQAYTGQTPDEYCGLGWRQSFDEAGRKELDAAWGRATSTGETFELELNLMHFESQAYRRVRLRAVPVLADGKVREWMGAISDIEDRYLLEQNLRTLNAELEQRVAERTARLEEANRDLEGFSYSVSHDLRAPVRAIGGFCALLEKDHGEALDGEARRKLGVIRSEAERMGALIDDLLAFSRLGRKSLDLTELDMTEIAGNVFRRLGNGQGWSGDGSDGPELKLGALPKAIGDRSLLEQVWVNLLSNAIKFSAGKAHPVIEVGAINEEREHVYYVRDNGVGYDPRHSDKLFGVFQRLHHSDEFPGTGVGLALVHKIVTRHGGRVWADAKPGEGATFHFTLPRERSIGRV